MARNAQRISHQLVPPHQRGISKSDLRTRLENCFALSSNSTTSTELSTLINRTIHLFQAYDNILQVVYPSSWSSRGGGKLRSLLEICAREIGWEIESNLREWLEQQEVDDDGGSDVEGEWTIEKMDRHLNRAEASIRRRRSSLVPVESGDDEEDQTTSRRTSGSSFQKGSRGLEDLTRGEQELETCRIQDEAYESCPSHTYRWILAEHATSIVYNELCDVFERGDRLPCELVEIWFDWCLCYGATSEASRFQPLLISTALQPLLSSSLTITSKSNFIPLLLKSPSPLSLLSEIESHLSESMFKDKLFFHPYLSTTSPSLFHSFDESNMGRIKEYLEMMVDLATRMVQSYLTVYRDERGLSMSEKEELVRLEGFEKDTKEIFERVLKLVGAVTGDNALRSALSRSSRCKGKRSAVGRRGGLLEGLTKMSSMSGGAELEDLRNALSGLLEVAREVERAVGLVDRNGSSSDSEEEEEDEKLPTISEQLGSIIVLFDLVNSTHLNSSSTDPIQTSVPSSYSSTTVSAPLLSYYISTHLLHSISPTLLLDSYDPLSRTPTTVTALQVERAILMSLKGGGIEMEEEFELKVEKRWTKLEARILEARTRNLSGRMNSGARETLKERRDHPPHRTSSQPRSRHQARKSFDSSIDSQPDASNSDSDSDILIISPSQSPAPRSPSPPSRPPSRYLPPPAPTALDNTSVSSEPDELALLPPPRRFLVSASPPKAKKTKQKRPSARRITVQAPLSPSPDAPFEENGSSRSHRSKSPTLLSRTNENRKKEDRIVVHPRNRRLDSHVRTHSAPTIILKEIISNVRHGDDREEEEEEDDDDELMMSF